MYGVLDTGEATSTKSIDKSISLLGGNPGIYLKTSSKYLTTEWSSMIATLSLAASSIWDANI
jgi:hypothetical protein